MRQSVSILFVLAIGVCPEQQFLPLTGLDATKVVTDPVSQQPACIGRLYRYTGEAIEIAGNVCDPDNQEPNYPPQALKVWREPSNVELPLDPNDNYRFTVQYDTNGWHYETVCLTDGVAIRKGTVAIYTRTNRPPVLGCGSLAQ